MLHFNENSNRAHATTKQGEARYDITFPKYKKGGYVVRKVTEDATYGKHRLHNMSLHSLFYKWCVHCCLKCLQYLRRLRLQHNTVTTGYVEELMEECIDRCKTGQRSTLSSTPASLRSTYERPDKSVAIQRHKSRFNFTS